MFGPLTLVLTAVALGVAGSFTPCALGINAVFLGAVMDQSRIRRIHGWVLFAGARALLLTALGLGFGLLGQTIQGYAWSFQVLVDVGLILLGLLFIVHCFHPLPFPSLSLVGRRAPRSNMGMAGLGALFGLDISACIGPLVLGLLAETVLLGNWWSGALALFVFGVGLSLPLLVATMLERANTWLVNIAQRYQTMFYLVAGIALMLFGAAELLLSAAGRYTV
jgi:cytochrome c-type biogenesis protein